MDAGTSFYGGALARAHHADFGWVARAAAATLLAELAAAGHRSGTVVDLGCGSGILSGVVRRAGYDVQGVDLSADMLALAGAHVPDGTFRQGSVFDAELPAGAVAVAAVGEVLGYRADERAGLEALAAVAVRVAAALVPGGVFLIDLAAPGRAGPDGRALVVHDTPGYLLVSDAREDRGAVPPTLERRIVVFARRDDGAWARFDERHELALLDPDAVAACLAGAGFAVRRPPGYAPVDGAPPAMPPGWQVFVATRA